MNRAVNRADTLFDADLLTGLDRFAGGPPLSAGTLAAAREQMAAFNPTPAEAIGDRPIAWREYRAAGLDGAPGVALTVLHPRGPLRSPAPLLYNIHGGGMVLDNRFGDLPRMVALVEEFGFVAATVEYRLAPEHPHPAPIEDCYAGLLWLAAHAGELGADPDRLVVMGGSAGGGLAAGLALLARDRGGPRIAAQLLLCPMIDDRNDSDSTREYAADGTWTRDSNALGWRSLLGPGAPDGYAAPARADDLRGLPPAFVEVGAAEIFRDEDVDYCRRLWSAGVPAELHVWARAYHGFDRFAPTSETARAARASRSSWLRRVLTLDPASP